MLVNGGDADHLFEDEGAVPIARISFVILFSGFLGNERIAGDATKAEHLRPVMRENPWVKHGIKCQGQRHCAPLFVFKITLSKKVDGFPLEHSAGFAEVKSFF